MEDEVLIINCIKQLHPSNTMASCVQIDLFPLGSSLRLLGHLEILISIKKYGCRFFSFKTKPINNYNTFYFNF